MANKQELDNAFSKYVERMNEVNELSAPSLEEVTDANDYSRLLLYNFKKIGELSGENREVVDQVFMPLLNREEALSEEEIEALEGVNNLLIDMTAENMTNVDAHLAELVGERIEKERSKEDEDQEADADVTADEAKVRTLDKNIDVACRKLLDCLRCNNIDEARRIHEKGLKEYQQNLAYLEKERFLSLSDPAKKMVLVNTYFGANLYDYFDEKKMLEQLAYAISVLENPFYRQVLSEDEYRSYVFRAYEYAAEMSYFDGYRYQKTYQEAYENACKMEQIWHSDPEFYGNLMKKETVSIICLYGAARTQDPLLESRLDEAVKLFEVRDFSDYSYRGTASNLDSAVILFEVLEIARTGGEISLPEAYLRLQRQIPDEIINYLYRADDAKLIKWLLAITGNLVDCFREVPGGMKGGELFLKLIVALHPPTYVHSCMVAKLTLCLTRHALKKRPELFVNFPGCGSVEAVREKRDEILEYAYNAALYHDLGKLMILDTIAMYGRKLLDSEFQSLKVHPDNGAKIAEKLPSLRPYVDVIRGHHLWHDGSHGYPAGFDTAVSPYKTIIDVVLTADCLDAATDRVGRSYSKGKTLEDYKNELREGAGTRYAPWMAEIFEEPEVEADVRYLLDEGRKELYRDTFRLLKDVSQIRK